MINEELVKKKYQEMKNMGISESPLGKKDGPGAIKMFINQKPKKVFIKLRVKSGDTEDLVYVGVNE